MTDPSLSIPNTLKAVCDHSRHFGLFDYVYAVISRRSQGLSIGINLNPDKVCNFDCVYCEVDRKTPGKPGAVDPERLRAELSTFLALVRAGGLSQEAKFAAVPNLTREIKDIAFSGDGEPTLVHNFSSCVRAVAEVKQSAQLESAKLVLITDAAGLDKADVRQGLKVLDANNGEVWAKLDAGSEDYFRQVNRSHVSFDRIHKNLLLTSRERPIVIQSLFLKLDGQGPSESELMAYCQRLNHLVANGGQLKEVHVYTVARPAAEQFVSRLSAPELEQIASLIRDRCQLKVCSFP